MEIKSCPFCHRVYEGETMVFCLDDGNRLLGTGRADAAPTLTLPASGVDESKKRPAKALDPTLEAKLPLVDRPTIGQSPSTRLEDDRRSNVRLWVFGVSALVIVAGIIIVLSVSFGRRQVGQTVSSTSTESPRPTASSSQAAVSNIAPSDKQAIEKELIGIEEDWERIIKERDVEAVKRNEADDAYFVYPDGSTGNKAQDISDIRSGSMTVDSWKITDLKVTILNENSAVVSGRSIVKGGKYKAPNGAINDISGQYVFTDTYVRRDGRWQLVRGQTTPKI